jgi:hypothetical protein
MPIRLFGRKISVQVDALVLDGLTVSFDVTKSLAAKTPNTAEIRIWNLNPPHRKKLQELDRVYVSLEAGYEEGTTLVFRGDLRGVTHAREGANWITTVTSDTGRVARKKRILKSFAPQSTVTDVLNAAASKMGLKLGNTSLKTIAAKIHGTGAANFFNGYALAGAVVDEVDRLARSVGLEWSVQDDELQFLDKGQPLQLEGVLLTPSTGLIGSPEPGNKGLLEARCLLMPGIDPGRRVQIASHHVNGVYRIETTKSHGGTAEKEWYIDMQLQDPQLKKKAAQP